MKVWARQLLSVQQQIQSKYLGSCNPHHLFPRIRDSRIKSPPLSSQGSNCPSNPPAIPSRLSSHGWQQGLLVTHLVIHFCIQESLFRTITFISLLFSSRRRNVRKEIQKYNRRDKESKQWNKILSESYMDFVEFPFLIILRIIKNRLPSCPFGSCKVLGLVPLLTWTPSLAGGSPQDRGPLRGSCTEASGVQGCQPPLSGCRVSGVIE